MQLSPPERSEWLRQLATEVLAHQAPEETLLVDSYDPTNRHYGRTSQGPSGFGLEAGIALLLPLVWKLGEKLLDALMREATDQIIAKLKTRLATKPAARPPDETLAAELSTWAEKELVQNGLSEEKSPAVAKAFVEAFLKQAGQNKN